METPQFILDGHGNDLKAAHIDEGDEAMQEFIDNVTAFQEKIRLMNQSLEAGSLHGLQVRYIIPSAFKNMNFIYQVYRLGLKSGLQVARSCRAS